MQIIYRYKITKKNANEYNKAYNCNDKKSLGYQNIPTSKIMKKHKTKFNVNTKNDLFSHHVCFLN